MTHTRPLAAEFIGTFWLVFGGCGSAVLAAAFPEVGIGLAGVSLAFGLSVLVMAYAIGHISGCHLNPAVSVGLAAAGRFHWADVLPYAAVQVSGAIVASSALYVIASSNPTFSLASGFAANGYAAHSPGGYSLAAGLLAEIILTTIFIIVILGSTDERAPHGFAPIAIGLSLAGIHLMGIPITNVSVNPARSTGPAVMGAGAVVDVLGGAHCGRDCWSARVQLDGASAGGGAGRDEGSADRGLKAVYVAAATSA